jgi:hypothetical protein
MMLLCELLHNQSLKTVTNVTVLKSDLEIAPQQIIGGLPPQHFSHAALL